MERPRHFFSAIVLTAAAVGQIVFAFVFPAKPGDTALRNAGWVILWISAVLGWLPIFTLKKWGGVTRGESYVRTTALVERGVYRIVRHPQYTAGILLAVGLGLIAQSWAAGILGSIVAGTAYASTFLEERRLLAQFGSQYEAYQRRVPRVNIIIGLARVLLYRREL